MKNIIITIIMLIVLAFIIGCRGGSYQNDPIRPDDTPWSYEYCPSNMSSSDDWIHECKDPNGGYWRHPSNCSECHTRP